MLVTAGVLAPTAAREIHAAPVAEIVGEATISTPDDEFGGCPSGDGMTFYFNKTVPAHYQYILCESRWIGGKWSAPTVLPFSGQYRDSDGVLSPDGGTMLFASDRPIRGKDEHRFTIWRSRQHDGRWQTPELLPGPVNEAGSQVFASLATNGNLYFTTSRKTGNYDIYRSRFVDGSYQKAEELGPDLNGPAISTLEAFVAPDESYILLGSFGRANGYGNSDLFITFPEKGGWTKPKNLGPAINTAAREYSPRVSSDGKWLYFTSEQGMQIEPRTAPLTHADFVKKTRSVTNGLGNIYRIPMDYVLRNAHEANEMGVVP